MGITTWKTIPILIYLWTFVRNFTSVDVLPDYLFPQKDGTSKYKGFHFSNSSSLKQ